MALYLKSYSWQRDVLIIGSAILIFSFIGPFGSFDDLSFLARLLFWSISVIGCGAIFWLVALFVGKITMLKNIPAFASHSLFVFLTAFPGAVLIYYNNLIFRKIAFPPEKWVWLWFTVFIIGMIITSLNFFTHFGKSLSKKAKHKEEISKIHVKTDQNILKFLDRLPKEVGLELISLSSHDHYVDVVTKYGSHLMYMKFSDAIKELKNYPGVRIHRSHWVALSAIKTVKKTGRSKTLELTDGRVLPISKKYEDAVNEDYL